MQRLFFLCALILPFFIACEENVVPLPLEENQGDFISFTTPVVGHQSIYLAYTANSDRSNGPTPITYTGDTLTLTIASQNGNEFEVEAAYSGGQSPDTYVLSVQNGTLTIDQAQGNTGDSDFISPEFLPLSLPLAVLTNPVVPISLPEMSNTCFQSICEASTLNHEQLGKTYPKLNLSAFLGNMAVDGPGHYVAYSEETGIVRSSSISAWTQMESGWNLLSSD